MIVGIDASMSVDVTLDDILNPVVGFAFYTSDGRLFDIRNITDAKALLSPHGDGLHANEHTHIFQLIDGEHVTKMHYVRNSDDQVSRVCVETNLRKSLWFGKACAGQVKTLEIPEDHICGCCLRVYDRSGHQYAIGRIGLLAWPREDQSKSRALKEQAYEEIATENPNAEGKAFRTTAGDDLRAVLIETNSTVLSITAVSNVFFERLIALGNRVDVIGSHHMVEFLPNEKILGVEYGMEWSNVVAAVRLRTARRVSPWFGGHVVGEVRSVNCADPEHEFVCGFLGTKSSRGIHSLGVIVAKPKEHLTVEEKGYDHLNSDFEFCSREE